MKKSILITILIFSVNGYCNIKKYRNDSDKIILKNLEITKRNWYNKTPVKFCESVLINSYVNQVSLKKCNQRISYIDSIGWLSIYHKKLNSISEIPKSRTICNLEIYYPNKFTDTILFTQYDKLNYLKLSIKKKDTLSILYENYTIKTFETNQKFDSTIFKLKKLDSLIILMDTNMNEIMEVSISGHPTLKKLTIYIFYDYFTSVETERIISILRKSKSINLVNLPYTTFFEKEGYETLVNYCNQNKVKLILYDNLYYFDKSYIQKIRAIKKKQKLNFFQKIFH